MKRRMKESKRNVLEESERLTPWVARAKRGHG